MVLQEGDLINEYSEYAEFFALISVTLTKVRNFAVPLFSFAFDFTLYVSNKYQG